MRLTCTRGSSTSLTVVRGRAPGVVPRARPPLATGSAHRDHASSTGHSLPSRAWPTSLAFSPSLPECYTASSVLAATRLGCRGGLLAYSNRNVLQDQSYDELDWPEFPTTGEIYKSDSVSRDAVPRMGDELAEREALEPLVRTGTIITRNDWRIAARPKSRSFSRPVHRCVSPPSRGADKSELPPCVRFYVSPLTRRG